ncbi:MAG: hypothetical protein IT529_22855 [Burkholderiales bacterium]|nr:hypothetical protein [Burkholderiales bacterium]
MPTAIVSLGVGVSTLTTGPVPMAGATLRVIGAESKTVTPSLAVARAISE